MHRDTLPIENLSIWAPLNNVTLDRVKVSSPPDDRGSGVIATADNAQEEDVLMRVPQELVLSLETVWIYAKSDKHLCQVLEAAGDYTRTARGAILIFLLLQITNATTKGKIGVSNPYSEYVKFLPALIPTPTFWDEDERSLLAGTSLEAALESKLKSLDREFTGLREKTMSIDWCRQYWWDTRADGLTFDDWKQVDAMYRSRALDLPGTGHAMVPCIDMANHASGDQTTAIYETDCNEDAVLILREGKRLKPDEEVTITYGDEKGACEMLFSYGFIESTMTSARELFLDLDMPDDDPLKVAKKAAAKSAPGFRLYIDGDSIAWEGSFIWLMIVNEEDGLEVSLLQDTSGEKELQASWKSEIIPDSLRLLSLIENDPLYDVFHLRAVITLQDRIEKQLFRFEKGRDHAKRCLEDENLDSSIRHYAGMLRDLEETLMLRAYEDFELKKSQLLISPTVQAYLDSQSTADGTTTEDDFS